ncbi:AzlD domain-containing protein [Alkalibacter mobilis]|uniref:AzlD domain-containing protein n=1 Tax=Alkalibacter mobilis TaxID=2787712 RepID=UPI00189F7F10|nr:AzlD domain-containing protein [Alkalibacter mobilis]MBF7095690.1 AzlD domain-containing protein [Alkalibacter mobilis]
MSEVLKAVIVMAVITYAIRLVPIALFTSKIKSKFVKSFLFYTPFAVLGAMTFPGILYSTGNIYFSMAGTLAAIITAYCERGLFKVAVSAVSVAAILGYIF